MKRGIAAATLVLLTACGGASPEPGPRTSLRQRFREWVWSWRPERLAEGTSRRTIQVGGEERQYLLHIPPGSAAPLPLVISFHGLHSSAAQEERVTGFSALADREHFAAVYPEGERARWRVFGRDDADVRFVEALIEELGREKRVDLHRVYANGISNGAQMTLRLACDRPRLLAAVGFVAGGYAEVCAEPRAPALLFHGTKDHLLPYGGRGAQMPVRDFARAWAAAGDCHPAERGQVFYQKGDATGERWTCGGRVVDLYTLAARGHSWPGSSMPAFITSQDVNATEVLWRFFAPRRTGDQ